MITVTVEPEFMTGGARMFAKGDLSYNNLQRLYRAYNKEVHAYEIKRCFFIKRYLYVYFQNTDGKRPDGTRGFHLIDLWR